MTLEEKLSQAVQLVEDVKKEIEASKGIKPYDWGDKRRYCITAMGNFDTQCNATVRLFNFEEREEMERFAHKLKILSCINNLKKTLGCNWEFTTAASNYSLNFETLDSTWTSVSTRIYSDGFIHFKTQKDCEKVAEYLNTHYPNGWSLNTEGA